LLNFWTKDLSIRDLSDRISLTVFNSEGEDPARNTGYSVSMVTEASSKQLLIFNCLLKWVSDKFLFSEEAVSDEWSLTDLRKLVLYLTFAVLDKGESP
jgi:hypothetical protein